MTQRTRGPLLSIDTIAPERPFILIDGEPYELSLLTDFGIEAHGRLARYQESWARLEKLDDPSRQPQESDVADVQIMLREFVPMVVRGADAEILDKLNDQQKFGILRVFLVSVGLLSPEVAAEMTLEITETSLPDSNGSTEETRSDG